MKTATVLFAGSLLAWAFNDGLNSAQAVELPRFSRVEVLTNQEVELTVSAPAGQYCRLELGTNLADWQGLVTAWSTGTVAHTDTGGPYRPTTLYRAVAWSGAGVVTGDHLTTTNGDVVIHPINHASLVLWWNGLAIYVDPRTVARYQGLPRAGLILLTHNHSDHLDAATLSGVTNTGAVILAPAVVYTALPASLKALTITLTNGQSTTLLGLTVDAVPAYNHTAPNHPKGVGNGYVLTIGGRRIYLSGDTEDVAEMRALRDIDVAFLAVNRPYTMTVAQAVSATREFRPRVVYPYHYQPSNPITDLNAFKQQVGTDVGVEVRLRNWY